MDKDHMERERIARKINICDMYYSTNTSAGNPYNDGRCLSGTFRLNRVGISQAEVMRYIYPISNEVQGVCVRQCKWLTLRTGKGIVLRMSVVGHSNELARWKDNMDNIFMYFNGEHYRETIKFMEA